MKKARMNISHSRFILFILKIFGEIVTTLFEMLQKRSTYALRSTVFAFCVIQEGFDFLYISFPFKLLSSLIRQSPFDISVSLILNLLLF